MCAKFLRHVISITANILGCGLQLVIHSTGDFDEDVSGKLDVNYLHPIVDTLRASNTSEAILTVTISQHHSSPAEADPGTYF